MSIAPKFVEGTFIDVPCKDGVWINKNMPLFNYDEETMYTAFEQNVKTIPDRDFLGERFRSKESGGDEWGPFEWIKQKEAGELVTALGSALVNELGEASEANVGICSPNCPAWILAQYAMYRQDMVPVPLYPTLGESSIAFILDQTEARTIFCANRSIEGLLQIIFSQSRDFDDKTGNNDSEEKKKFVSHVKTVVSMERRGVPFPELSDDVAGEVRRRGIRTVSWDELIAAGRARPAEATPARPDGLFGIVYTSGSTGTPKGVMVTHRNVCNAVDIMYSAPQFKEPLDNWRYLSYLPLAHSMELELSSIMIKGRGLIGFCPSVARLFDDLALLRPDFFPTVPRVWKKFYDKVNETIAQSYVRKLVFDLAYAAKKGAMERGTTTWINWDALVFNAISSKLGGCVKISMCGAAPLDGEVIEWLKVTCGIQTYQVYGLTESFGGIVAQVPPHTGENSSIGIPIDRAEVRLVDVPEMNYSVRDDPPRGEIVLRAPNIFAGYYKEPVKTAEVLTDDAWFYTGDCARYNPDGTLNIIDRKKNIFKLAQGEYVAVEMVELTYSYSPYVSQIWVWGDSNDPFLVAVVVPDPDYLRKLAADVMATTTTTTTATTTTTSGSSNEAVAVPDPATATIAELCSSQAINERLLAELARTGRERKLKGYEILRGIVLEPEPWAPASDVMTPTLKIKRPQMALRYRSQLDALCKKIRASNASGSGNGSGDPKTSEGDTQQQQQQQQQQKSLFLRIFGF